MAKRLVTNEEVKDLAEGIKVNGVDFYIGPRPTRRLLATVKALREGLEDALDGMRDMRPYVFEYFAEKWDHDAYIKRAEDLLARLEGTEKP
jgi:hypothetical protein